MSKVSMDNQQIRTSLMVALILLLNSVCVDAIGYKGDLHIHTNYTNCEPERIGISANGVATVEERKLNAIELGLSWFSITDHSYCHNPTTWDTYKNEVDVENAKPDDLIS